MKKRLDQLLVDRGFCSSREKAKRLILAGAVRVNGRTATKPGELISPDATLEVEEPEKYVSRGGLKLEHALRYFGLDVSGCVAIDIGASTGGFTDCLLQRGAAKVYAIDVGKGQLAWKLRTDPRVVVMEQTNARYLSIEKMPSGFEPVDIVVIDVSFISLEKILPAAVALLKKSGKIVALIKPQFEAGKEQADKGKGVIHDPMVRAAVVEKIRRFVETIGGLKWRGYTESPIKGPAGNVEYLALIEKEK